MAMKDISDVKVLKAVEDWRADPFREEHHRPYTILAAETGQCEKVCFRCMERAYDRGYIDYGVSLHTGWLTEKGKELLKGSSKCE